MNAILTTSVINPCSHKTTQTTRSVCQRIKKDTSTNTPIRPKQPESQNPNHPNPQTLNHKAQTWNAANVSLPIPYTIVKEQVRSFKSVWTIVVGSGVLLAPPVGVNEIPDASQHHHIRKRRC